MYTGVEAGCQDVVDCLWLYLARKTGLYQISPLTMPRKTASLVNKSLIQHFHNVLARDIPSLYPAILRYQGLLIVTHIGQVAVDFRQDREDKARLWSQTEAKDVT